MDASLNPKQIAINFINPRMCARKNILKWFISNVQFNEDSLVLVANPRIYYYIIKWAQSCFRPLFLLPRNEAGGRPKCSLFMAQAVLLRCSGQFRSC